MSVYSSTPDSTATLADAITPNDGADLPRVVKALYVGGAGAIALTTEYGSTVTFTGVTAGSVLPVRVKKVSATGTTATGLIGLI